LGANRRLLAFISIALIVDTAAYAAITPLLPHFTREYHLSKAAAGVLTAAYAFGNLVLAIPAGALAARIGPKRTVVSALAFLAAASLCFGLASSSGALVAARLLQGFGAAAVWAGGLAWVVAVAPRERRAEAIGTAIGAAIAGALGGPVLGAVADRVGTGIVFGAFVILPLGLILALLPQPSPPSVRLPGLGALRTALGDHRVRVGMWLMLLPSLAFGIINVLVPLRLDHFGAGAIAIGATFLAAVVFESFMSPVVGRMTDRSGAATPARIGLAAGAVVIALLPLAKSAVPLALGAIVAAPLIGMLWAPAMALISDGAEARAIDVAFAFGLANMAWGLGATLGGSGGGALAQATTDAVPYLAVAGAAFVTALALRGRARDPVVADRAG
jgi:MFS family permease